MCLFPIVSTDHLLSWASIGETKWKQKEFMARLNKFWHAVQLYKTAYQCTITRDYKCKYTSPNSRPRHCRISLTNCIKFPRRWSRWLTSHTAIEFLQRRYRHILSPVFLCNHRKSGLFKCCFISSFPVIKSEIDRPCHTLLCSNSLIVLIVFYNRSISGLLAFM